MHVCVVTCMDVCVCAHMHVDMDSNREMEQNPGPRYMLHAVTVNSLNLILQNHLEDQPLSLSSTC